MALLIRTRAGGRGRRPASRALALSLFVHALAFCGLWCWTGSAAAPLRRDESVVSIRVRSQPEPSPPALETPPTIDRSSIPQKPEWPPLELEAVRIEDLDDSTNLVISEPESALRSGLGASPAGHLRAPASARRAAAAAESAPALAAAPPALGVAAPGIADAPRAEAGSARVLACPRPLYPRHSVRLHEQGSVRCELEIDARGGVLAVRVLVSSGYERLDAAAREALLRWRFEAAAGALAGSSWKLEHTVVFRIE